MATQCHPTNSLAPPAWRHSFQRHNLHFFFHQNDRSHNWNLPGSRYSLDFWRVIKYHSHGLAVKKVHPRRFQASASPLLEFCIRKATVAKQNRKVKESKCKRACNRVKSSSNNGERICDRVLRGDITCETLEIFGVGKDASNSPSQERWPLHWLLEMMPVEQ